MKPSNTNTAKPKGSNKLSDVKYVIKHPLVYSGAFVLVITIVPLWLRIIPYTVAGPILGTAITLIATGLHSAMNYLSTTTTLSHEFDVECESYDCSKGRIIIRVKNTGKNIAEDAYALVSIRAREKRGAPEEVYLGIEDELLPWLLYPENIATKVSIDPGHSRELLVFEYERVPVGYVIRVPSEGSIYKPRDLWLDFDTKYVFHITAYGKNVRSPLNVELYITMDKLDAIASYGTMRNILTRLPIYIGEILFKPLSKEILDMVLRELGNDGGITERAADLRTKIFHLVLSDEWERLVELLRVMSGFEALPSDKEEYLEEYLGIASGFEALWNELKNKFGWLAEYLGLVFGVSYEYVVYLALAKRWDELTSFIRNNHLLSYCIDDVCVMTKLLLNLIIADEEFRKKFSDWLTGGNIYDSLAYYVPKHLRPALARLLPPFGYENITCEDACAIHGKEKYLDWKCYEDCDRILSAFDGNENRVKEIASELDSVLQRHRAYKNWVGGSSKEEKSAPPMLIKEIIDYVHNNEEPQDWGFFSRAVVELRLPTTSRLRFILILHNLLRAREEFEKGNIDEAIKFVDLAETHAVIGNIKYRGRIPSLSVASRFFISVEILASDLKSKLKGSRRFEISDIDVLKLLRLYHYHVQTNLAETWP